MWYLFIQIWVWLLAAFVLGWWAHWFLCCRDQNEKASTSASEDAATLAAVSAAAASPAAPVVDANSKPLGLASPPDTVDDLKRIKGIGSVVEETLNGLGIYQFAQIAAWNEDNILWVEDSLSFPGRIGREEWVNQAKTLVEGGITDFAKRVDEGHVDYE